MTEAHDVVMYGKEVVEARKRIQAQEFKNPEPLIDELITKAVEVMLQFFNARKLRLTHRAALAASILVKAIPQRIEAAQQNQVVVYVSNRDVLLSQEKKAELDKLDEVPRICAEPAEILKTS